MLLLLLLLLPLSRVPRFQARTTAVCPRWRSVEFSRLCKLRVFSRTIRIRACGRPRRGVARDSGGSSQDAARGRSRLRVASPITQRAEQTSLLSCGKASADEQEDLRYPSHTAARVAPEVGWDSRHGFARSRRRRSVTPSLPVEHKVPDPSGRVFPQQALGQLTLAVVFPAPAAAETRKRCPCSEVMHTEGLEFPG